MNTPTTTWITISRPSDDRLFEARAQLHQAAQLLAATGISFLTARTDDSHTAILWSSGENHFLSQTFGDNQSYQVTLNPSDLVLTVTNNGSSIYQLELNGISLRQAAANLQLVLDGYGFSKDNFTMNKHYELPDYPDRWETAFDTTDVEAFEVLVNSYANAFSLFSGIKSSEPAASDLLIWPHHFDLAILITMDTDAQGNLSKSIGVGLSPGDGSYTTPYYYITNWPYPSEDIKLPTLFSRGSWHTAGWTGMVLALDPITSVSTPDDQKRIVETFLDEALALAKTISQ
ncbi:hypothetical protein HQ531_13325 [bacterium]|nr:hypothetical protein [bacterium]